MPLPGQCSRVCSRVAPGGPRGLCSFRDQMLVLLQMKAELSSLICMPGSMVSGFIFQFPGVTVALSREADSLWLLHSGPRVLLLLQGSLSVSPRVLENLKSESFGLLWTKNGKSRPFQICLDSVRFWGQEASHLNFLCTSLQGRSMFVAPAPVEAA